MTFVAAITLRQLLQTCAAAVGSRTMSAIVRVESGGNPLVIHDNSIARTFYPHDARQAIVWANQLLRLHHSIDLGLSQINSANLHLLGLSVADVFDPCTNVNAGSTILAADYQAAVVHFGPGQYALRRAIGAYNSGSLFAGYRYIEEILQAAGLDSTANVTVPDLKAVSYKEPTALPAIARRRRSHARVRATHALQDPSGSPILVSSPQNQVSAPAPAPAPAAARATAAAALEPARARPARTAPYVQNPLSSAILVAPVQAPTAAPTVAPTATPVTTLKSPLPRASASAGP